MLMNDSEFRELDTFLAKKKNVKIRDYVHAIREEVESLNLRASQSIDDLSMNNTILDGNFESLIKALAKIDTTLASIEKSLDNHEKSVDSVSAASEELSQSSESIAESIVNQSSSLVEFASVLEEMSASINSVAGSTEEAKGIVDEVSGTTEQGNAIVGESVKAIEQIKESSEQITEITHVLQTIAVQSNLLAMNAAIEAAHAGEAGRGFAVVAEEMRKLSDNSRAEAGKIAAITKDIMLKIDNAVETTKQVISNNDQLMGGIGRTNEITTQIHNAMQEQAAGTQQVLKEVKSLTELTSGMKNSLEEQKTANHDLLEAVSVMRDAAADVGGMLDLQRQNRNEVADITNRIGWMYIRNLGICSALKGKE